MSHRTALASVVLMTLVGFFLRLYQLDAVPLRGDEAFSALFWSGLPLSETFSKIATIEPHPPATYIIFHLWGQLFGISSEWVLRLLPALCSVLGIPALYALGHQLGGRRAGLIAALLWAVQPYQIWHAQDFRNYAIWAGFSAVTLWLGLRLLSGHRRLIDWALYAAFALMSGLIFYTELFMLGTLGLYAIVTGWRSDRRLVLRLLGLQAAVTVAVIGAFVIFQSALFLRGGYGGTIGSTPVSLLNWFTRFIPVLNFGETLPPALAPITGPLLMIVLTVSWLIVLRHKRQHGLLLGIGILAPLAAQAIISTRMDIFHPRYVLASAPMYALVISQAIVTLSQQPRRQVRYIGITLIASAWAITVFTSLNSYWNNPAFRKAPDWPALTGYLTQNVHEDDLVIQTAVDAAFGYYYDATADDIGLPANPQQPVREIITTLERSRDQYASLWIVARTFADWPNTGIVEDWAASNMQLIRDTQTDGLPIRQYKRWEIDADAFSGPPLAQFGDIVTLLGADVADYDEPTHERTIQLYWQVESTSTESLKTFVHLVGVTNPQTGSPLWAQDDHFPQAGRILTTSWQAGTIYRDLYQLPMADLPPGEYSLLAGWYDPVNGNRLTTDADQDTVRIGSIIIP